jgi:hypothetical protein
MMTKWLCKRKVVWLMAVSLLSWNGARATDVPTVADHTAAKADVPRIRDCPGTSQHAAPENTVVEWAGEKGVRFQAAFAVEGGQPCIRQLQFRNDGEWKVLAHNLAPEFEVTTGIRRTGHGLPEEKRWDVYWDAPLNHPEEVHRAQAVFQAEKIEVRTIGVRKEVAFPGVTMGNFLGRLQFTVYEGSNLLRMEIIAKTEEPSVAYKYSGGLRGFEARRIAWHDVDARLQTLTMTDETTRTITPVRARNRLLVLEAANGSVACFPPPHQFFFPRQLEINLGFFWYRPEGQTVAVGVRHGDSHEGYNPTFIEKVFPLYNAPPGTWQRMAAYFYLSPDGADACRSGALCYTRGDHFEPLPGYKTMACHFHVAFHTGFTDWIEPMRALGVNVVYLNDFHGDGHPKDLGPLRLAEQKAYYDACRKHSDQDFLILPGEEPNVYLGGHWDLLLPKPVYYTLVRAKGQPLVDEQPQFGRVWHVGSAEDVFEMIQQENALAWTSHPRTKGSTGYPDAVRDKGFFQSDYWLGTTFKAMPADLSRPRLGDPRCFSTLDDMNNWGRLKFMLGEVDTYKKFADYDLYGDFNVNYIKLDRLPSAEDWTPILKALRNGDFFVTTGEVLISRCEISDNEIKAEVQWTFPLEFVEAVWGDGKNIDHRIISAAELPPFDKRVFTIPIKPGQKWVRFAAWDSAGNGAFTQPVQLDHR